MSKDKPQKRQKGWIYFDEPIVYRSTHYPTYCIPLAALKFEDLDALYDAVNDEWNRRAEKEDRLTLLT